MSTWRKTDLSVSPASWQIGHGDREAFAFDAEEAISDATAALIDLDTRADAGTIEGPSIAGTVATVTVSGLTREHAYELSVTFTATGGRKWTRTLVLDCVA